MKRHLPVIALVLALALPSAALAGTRHFDGTVDPSGTISFDARTRSGRVVKVIPGLAFTHIPITCDDGAHTVSGDFDFAMSVRHRHFSGTGVYTGGGTVTVSGDFSARNRRASGTIRVLGDFSAQSWTGCHGKHDWTAKKT